MADYDKVGSILRIRGKNILENEHVKVTTVIIILFCFCFFFSFWNKKQLLIGILKMKKGKNVKGIPTPKGVKIKKDKK